MGWIDRIRRSRPEPIALRLYTRPGCHLCDELEQEIARTLPRGGYSLERVDVDSDRALKKRYGLRIPVLSFDGQFELEGRVDGSELRAGYEQATTTRAARRKEEGPS